MKKNLTKKLMLSVLTLAFAVVSLGASTFAWFTMSSNAKVSAFEGTVKGAEGVEIAISALTWNGDSTVPADEKYDSLVWYSGVLPADIIEDYIDDQFAFSALTSMGTGTFADVKGTTIDASHENAGKASAGYIGFRLWFKSANTASGETLNLTNIAITNSGTINKYTVDQQFTVSAPNSSDAQEEALVGSKWKFDVTSAARVSLHPQESANPDQTDKLPFVFEANESDTVIGADEVGVAGNSAGYKDTDGAWEYYNAKVQNSADQLQTAPTGPVCKQIGSVKNTKTESLPIITLTANTPTYVDVYVWIEGWDGECLNAIFTQALSVNFDFALSSSYNA